MPPANDRPKLPHEQVLLLLQKSAEQAMEMFPEPDAVIVTVVWDKKLGELPGAIVVPREAPMNAETTLRCVAQLAKSGAILITKIPLQMQMLWSAAVAKYEEQQREKEAGRGGSRSLGEGPAAGAGRPEGQPGA